MLTQVPSILSWRCRNGSAAAIYTGHRRYVRRKFGAWLGQACPEESAVSPEGQSHQLYEELPVSARERFLLAPETYRRIIRRPGPPRPGAVGFVLNSLWAEH